MANGKTRPTTVMGWAAEHWFLTGFFIVPALIGMPVALISALRGPTVGEGEEAAKRRAADAEAKLQAAQGRL